MVAWMPWLSKHPSLPLGICHLPIRYRNPLQPPRLSSSWMWWCLTVLLPFQKRRQEAWELEANLGLVRSSASKTKAAATKKERSSPQFFQAFPPRHPPVKGLLLFLQGRILYLGPSTSLYWKASPGGHSAHSVLVRCIYLLELLAVLLHPCIVES